MPHILKDVPILDLRKVSPDAFRLLERVDNVRTVILSSENADQFMRVPRTNVRSHVIVQPDEVLALGQIDLNDEYLKARSDASKVVILGHVFLSGFDEALFSQKIQRLRVFGQVLYSAWRSVALFLTRVERWQGQLLATPTDAVRWIGPTLLDQSRLRSVAGRDIVSIGPITIDAEVSVADVLQYLGRVVQIGEIAGREDTVCALLARCSRRVGTCRVVAPRLGVMASTEDSYIGVEASHGPLINIAPHAGA